MIIKKFTTKQKKIFYYVATSRIQFNSKPFEAEEILQIIEHFQKKHRELFMQLFYDKYVLNTTHIFYAYYYMQRAFYHKSNISNKKNIEFLLYLAASRQISTALRDFGINKEQLESDQISLCIISSEKITENLNLKIQEALISTETEFFLDHYTLKKYKNVQTYYEISQNQISSVLSSYGFEYPKEKITKNDLPQLYSALSDLICEKMALLSLEKSSHS